jgi:hypothetical protein
VTAAEVFEHSTNFEGLNPELLPPALEIHLASEPNQMNRVKIFLPLWGKFIVIKMLE